MDFYLNPYCNDLNAFYIFNYYKKNNNKNAYYVINSKSDLYKKLAEQNKTQNLLPVNSNDNIFEKLYYYFLIIVLYFRLKFKNNYQFLCFNIYSKISK
jgi:hypothetical protein